MNTGDITGRVVDPAGGIIAGAEVVAINADTQQSVRVATNDAGEYLLRGLPPGAYKLMASSGGFKQSVAGNVSLHVNEHLRQDFSLELGDERETVVVQAAPGLVQTESVEIKDVIENQQVTDLPLEDREFLELTLLSEGVVNPPGGTRGDSLQQTGKLINMLGQRTGHNLFLVDGVSVTDEYYNNVVLSPSPDDTREFKIEKTNYGAEFGGKSGGVINVVTQSGTDLFHGSAYEFLRNIFSMPGTFSIPAARRRHFRRISLAAAFGGPLSKRTRLFLPEL